MSQQTISSLNIDSVSDLIEYVNKINDTWLVFTIDL